ncbi:hypothetical protein G7Y89_g14803 [Cudoniella acicularis]|uniref:Uncharacterized protein n=1 Tax=Cudoniella acicularis TaxID=354080 RepID=A0A8H4QYK4_9HELO|nr:hypothetical protein G7Y89_g14803 [Cudoniella acicularis]
MARSKAPKPSIPEPKADDPLFTQENFEKELKALASKAKEETWGRWATEQALVLIKSATLLSLAAIYSNVSQLTLSPIYGSIPASIWHSKGVMTACFLGWSFNLFIRRRLPVKPITLLPLIAAYIPTVQFFLFKVSGLLGGTYGPTIIETLTYFPLLVLSASCTATVLDDLEMNPGRLQWLSDAMPGISSYTFFKIAEHYSNNYIEETIGTTFIQTRLGFEIILGGIYTIFAPSKLMLYAIPALIHTAFFNYHVQTPLATSSLNATMMKSGWTLIDRQESLTGYISIIESADQGFKVMRCDHSLLGGEWLAYKSTTGLAEPIYGVFVMLEAVRLIEVPEPVPQDEQTALVM